MQRQVQCAAVAIRSGVRCLRKAGPGGRYCRTHLRARVGDVEEEFHAAADVAIQPLATALSPEDPPEGIGIAEEIAMLRRQIREAEQMGDTEGARRGIETLIRAVKVQRVIAGQSEDSLSSALSKVLEEVGAELATSQ